MRRVGKICIIIGILLGLAALGWHLFNEADEQRARYETEIILEEMRSVVEKEKMDTGNRSGTSDSVVDEMPYVEVDGHRYIGYIHVPELSLSLPVQADWDMEKLKYSPCRYAGSLNSNDLIIAGHNYKAHFSPIKTLQEGDEVIFENVQGEKVVYKVSQILEIDGNDAKTMNSNSDSWDLTLFTCNYGGKARVTLRCVREIGY